MKNKIRNMQKLYVILLILLVWSCSTKEKKEQQANELVIPVTVRMVGEIEKLYKKGAEDVRAIDEAKRLTRRLECSDTY